MFLGREPENESVTEGWQAAGSYEELCHLFLASSEYRNKHPELRKAPFMPLDAPPLDVEWQADERVLS